MKIAVTTLDSFRYWKETEFMDEEREFKALQELIAKIKGVRSSLSEPALKGIALANALENPDECFQFETGNYMSEGYEFDGATMAEFMLTMPAEAHKEIWLPQYTYGNHYLVARADLMWQNKLGDVKLITKAFNAKKLDSYTESIQWQAECLMGDCEEFQYFIAQSKENKKDYVIKLANFQNFTFYRSQATDDRVHHLMYEFGEFAKPYLPAEEHESAQKQTQEE